MDHNKQVLPEQADVVIVGGGSAGLAAAVKLYQNGIRNIIILEREKHLGGFCVNASMTDSA